ncbi:hypothetical protein E4U14_007078 [Claviceps sp. LM454 group G7]|nr:hypothetical protein E4U14_007078 [Claviceps sp. LM454 group G7]
MWTAAPLSSVPRAMSRSTTRISAFSKTIPSSSSSSSNPFPLLPSISTAARTLIRRPRCDGPLLSLSRSFTTSTPQLTKTIKPHLLPTKLIPPYPFGERRVYKQSNCGLYGSARIRFGNTVMRKWNTRSPRFWRPNLHVKTFYSPALGANIKTKLTLRVLKTIRREGGIESYILKSKLARIKDLGPSGWALRWILMQTQTVQKQFNEERLALGLETKPIENRDDLIQFALDAATPGPLSTRSWATMQGLRATTADAFVLGDDGSEAVGAVKELSDEDEAILLQELEHDNVAKQNSSVSVKTP